MEDINLTLGNSEQARREESATAEISDAARKTVESLRTIGFSITKPVRAIEMEVEDHKVLILPNGDAVPVIDGKQLMPEKSFTIPSKPSI